MIEEPLGDQHLYAKKHTDFILAFDLVDEDGNKADLTGCFFAMQVRTSNEAASAALTITSGAGGFAEFDKTVSTPLGPYTCSVYAKVPFLTINALANGDYVYDGVLTDAGGVRYPLFGGKFNVSGNATQVGAP